MSRPSDDEPTAPRSLGAQWPRRRFLGVSGLVGAAALVAPLLPSAPASASPGTKGRSRPDDLSSEHTAEPLGLDTTRPRLSWQSGGNGGNGSNGGNGGTRQQAYRIIVGTREARVAAGHGDEWDSGQVRSDQSVDVVYDGAPLVPGRRYYWAVQTWDERGAASGWSTLSWFELGPQDEADWAGAAWIQAASTPMPSLAQSHWIWFPEGAPGAYFPAEVRYFRQTFTVADAAAVTAATVVMTADDYFDLYVNGTLVASRPNETNGWQQAQVYDVRSLLQTGDNVVAVAVTNAADPTPTPAGLLAVLQISAGSAVTAIPTDTTWRTAQTDPSGWTELGFDDSSWATPLDQGVYGTGIWGSGVTVSVDAPAPYLRRNFSLGKPVESARLYVCGLGYYVASLNGQRVGDHELDPAPSVYDQATLYASYDVTRQVQRGNNTVGLVLGRSFYAINSPNIYWDNAAWIAAQPAALLSLQVTHTDGSTTTIVSDGNWSTHAGPTQSDSVYNGDVYDARAALAAWDRPGASTAGWLPAAVDTDTRLPATRRSQQMPPVRVTATLRATSITQLASGSYVFRFPRMIAGRPRLRVRAPAGTTIDLRYGEICNDDGTVDNQGDPGITPGEIQHDSYTTAGSGLETWAASFSYGSFQYVQVDGYPGTPTLDSVTAQELHTDVAESGDFRCSDDLINTVHQMTRTTILNNFTGIPTDTPMYEKRGWFGDASLFCAPSLDNFDAQTFWTNFLATMADDQGSNGNFGDLAPAAGPGQGADPTWSTAGLVIPWMLYQECGDLGVLEAHYSSMTRFVDYLTSVASGSILNGTYGDWCSPGNVAPPEGAKLTSTASYFRCATLLTQIADALGESADAATYAALADDIRGAFNAAFLDTAAGIYRSDIATPYRQSSNAYPLFLGLVPDENRDAVVANLVSQIAADGNHLDTGIVGTMALFPALTEHGQVDLAFQVVTQQTYPSYGYWASLGATTLWEQWIATPRSHDHAMFGSVDDWFYKYLGGIRPAAPGYKQIAIQPYVPAGLTSVTCHRDTPYGRVSVDWRASKKTFRLDVSVPANTTATVTVPTTSGGRVKAGSGATRVASSPGWATFRVEPGTHTVTVGV